MQAAEPNSPDVAPAVSPTPALSVAAERQAPQVNTLAQDLAIRTDMLSRSLRPLAAALFGVVFPLILLWQAYMFVGSSTMRDNVQAVATASAFPAQLSKLSSAQDYALFAMIYAESSNRMVMLNKQMMKMAVVHIGFAVISIGMLFLLLGIDAGGIQVDGKHGASGSQVNLRVASTGVLIFMIGAGMAALGGITRNNYSTPGIPNFLGGATVMSDITWPQKALEQYDQCQNQYKDSEVLARACLANWMDDTVHGAAP